jgi:hypothetical protein
LASFCCPAYFSYPSTTDKTKRIGISVFGNNNEKNNNNKNTEKKEERKYRDKLCEKNTEKEYEHTFSSNQNNKPHFSPLLVNRIAGSLHTFLGFTSSVCLCVCVCPNVGTVLFLFYNFLNYQKKKERKQFSS